MSKREKVVRLLEVMYDWIQGPRTSTGAIVQKSSSPGETPSVTVDCPACKGTGKRGREVCDQCSRGQIVVDDYTGRVAGAPAENAATEAIERRERRAKVSREILRLALDEKARESDLDVEGDPFTSSVEAKERHDRSGSFPELYAAIARLESEWPMHGVALRLVYEPGSVRVLPLRSSLLAAAEHAIDLITVWMPENLRVPHWALEDAGPVEAGKGRWANASQQARRNDLIYSLSDTGRGPTEIAREVGLSHSMVSRILQARPVPTQGMVA